MFSARLQQLTGGKRDHSASFINPKKRGRNYNELKKAAVINKPAS